MKAVNSSKESLKNYWASLFQNLLGHSFGRGQ